MKSVKVLANIGLLDQQKYGLPDAKEGDVVEVEDYQAVVLTDILKVGLLKTEDDKEETVPKRTVGKAEVGAEPAKFQSAETIERPGHPTHVTTGKVPLDSTVGHTAEEDDKQRSKKK